MADPSHEHILRAGHVVSDGVGDPVEAAVRITHHLSVIRKPFESLLEGFHGPTEFDRHHFRTSDEESWHGRTVGIGQQVEP